MLDIWINIFIIIAIAFAIGFLIAAIIHLMLMVAQTSGKRPKAGINPVYDRARQIHAFRKKRVKEIMKEPTSFPIINYYYARPEAASKPAGPPKQAGPAKIKRPEAPKITKKQHGKYTSF
jgi:hypothetical protein